MNCITSYFALPCGMKPLCLLHRFFHTDEDFPMEQSTPLSSEPPAYYCPDKPLACCISPVIKRNHIRRASMMQKGLIEPGYLSHGNQVNS